jgi:hypothetical protein
MATMVDRLPMHLFSNLTMSETIADAFILQLDEVFCFLASAAASAFTRRRMCVHLVNEIV